LRYTLIAELVEQLLVRYEPKGESTSQLLDENELQQHDFPRSVALDGLALEIANVFTAFHNEEILAVRKASASSNIKSKAARRRLAL
jgi:hypothetical protein